LLDELKHLLQQRQTPLVIGEVHFGVFCDLREPRAARDNETSNRRFRNYPLAGHVADITESTRLTLAV
jgi:hypothetical protein